MHARHLNEQLVRVLKTIGYDVGFQKGQGQYLFDRDGARYLDLLSGFGVFAIGRNHPALRQALKGVLDSDFPNLVQLDVSTLAGVLAERLLEHVPYLDKVFFANSGAETVEAAIKFARGATGRPGIVSCSHSFHGLSYGALSLMDDANFRSGFEPLLPGCTQIPFNDLAALEQALSSRQVAAFIVEPIQGKGVNLPTDEFLPGAAALCKKYGSLFIADEIQTGIGRTGTCHSGAPPRRDHRRGRDRSQRDCTHNCAPDQPERAAEQLVRDDPLQEREAGDVLEAVRGTHDREQQDCGREGRERRDQRDR